MKFIYTGIRVRNLKRSVEFYTKTMGMKEIQRGKMHAGGVYVQLKSRDSEQELELNYYHLERNTVKNMWKVRSWTI